MRNRKTRRSIMPWFVFVVGAAVGAVLPSFAVVIICCVALAIGLLEKS